MTVDPWTVDSWAAAAGEPTVGGVGELAAIAAFTPALPSAAGRLLGPGDDAAVLAVPDGRVVVTTDTMLQGPDFRTAWSSPADVGWKLAATNLADLAAMGARPSALVVSIAVPAGTPVRALVEFAGGMRDACVALAPGCGVEGGDLATGSLVVASATALGELDGRAPVTRAAARPGDVVAVSGVLGAAARGLTRLFREAMVDGVPDAALAAALRRGDPDVLAQLRPTPPIADGPLAALAGATAMLDVSDGLALDARRIAAASGVAIALDAAALASPGARPDPVLLDGGEDHALLATFPAGTALPGGFRAIGRVTAGSGVLVDGVPYAAAGGWDPFAGWDGGAG